MIKMLQALLSNGLHPTRTQDLREQTHQALNEAQAKVLVYQNESRKTRSKLLKKLTETDQQLSSVAEQIAVATGANRRTK